MNNSTQKHKISKKKRRKDEKAEKSKHRISCESPKPEEKPSLEVRQNGENQNEKESGILENNSDSGSELLSRARQFILAAGEIEKMVKQSEASQGEREVECLEVTDHSKREAIEQSKESEDQLIQHTQEVITQQKRPNITKRSTLTDQKISNPEISVKPEEILEKKKQVEKFHELTQQRVRKRLEKQKEVMFRIFGIIQCACIYHPFYSNQNYNTQILKYHNYIFPHNSWNKESRNRKRKEKKKCKKRKKRMRKCIELHKEKQGKNFTSLFFFYC